MVSRDRWVPIWKCSSGSMSDSEGLTYTVMDREGHLKWQHGHNISEICPKTALKSQLRAG